MYPHELNKLTEKFIVESGHGMCHPETCSCWNFRVYKIKPVDKKRGENVLNSDGLDEVKDYLRKNDPGFTL